MTSIKLKGESLLICPSKKDMASCEAEQGCRWNAQTSKCQKIRVSRKRPDYLQKRISELEAENKRLNDENTELRETIRDVKDEFYDALNFLDKDILAEYKNSGFFDGVFGGLH